MEELAKLLEDALENLENCDLAENGGPCRTCLGDSVARLKQIRRRIAPQVVGVEGNEPEEVWF